ncbi:hypothetical protein [Thalassotalea montiporae]
MLYLNPILSHSDWTVVPVEHRPRNRRLRYYSNQLKADDLPVDIKVYTYKKDESCYAIHYKNKLYGIVNDFGGFKYLGEKHKYEKNSSIYPYRYCLNSASLRIAIVKKGYEDAIYLDKKYVGSMRGLGMTWNCSGKVGHYWRIKKKIYKRKLKQQKNFGILFDLTKISLPLAVTLFMYATRWYNND